MSLLLCTRFSPSKWRMIDTGMAGRRCRPHCHGLQVAQGRRGTEKRPGPGRRVPPGDRALDPVGRGWAPALSHPACSLHVPVCGSPLGCLLKPSCTVVHPNRCSPLMRGVLAGRGPGIQDEGITHHGRPLIHGAACDMADYLKHNSVPGDPIYMMIDHIVYSLIGAEPPERPVPLRLQGCPVCSSGC